MMPACVLLAALITFGLFSRNHEIVAMKANGISLYRIARPVVAFALLACGLEFPAQRIRDPGGQLAGGVHQVRRGPEEEGMGGLQGEPDLVQEPECHLQLQALRSGRESAEGGHDQLPRCPIQPAFEDRRARGPLERGSLGTEGCPADDLCRQGLPGYRTPADACTSISPRRPKISWSYRKAPTRWASGS